MPNWCSNEVTIRGPKEILDKLEEMANKQELLGFIQPEPDYSVTPVPKACPEVAAMFAKTPEEREKALKNEPTIRDDSWWDWRILNWGTKWEPVIDCDRLHDPEILRLVFSSAWSPPVESYQAIMDKYEGVSVQALYFEPGCQFAGLFDAGVNTCINTSETPIEFYENSHIGRLLDEAFGMVDHIKYIEEMEREWEEKQKEKEHDPKKIDYKEYKEVTNA